VYGVDADPVFAPTATADRWDVVPLANADNYLDAVATCATAVDAVLVHPQPDPEVTRLSRAPHGMMPLVLPPADVIDVCASKAETARRLNAAGLTPMPHIPASELPDRFADLVGDNGTVWVRAVSGAGARGALPVRTADEAAHWVAWWAQRGIPADQFVASPYLAGREFAFTSLWWNGELVAGQQRERLRYLFGYVSPSGQTSSPSVARITDREDVSTLAVAAITALTDRPHGIFSVDVRCGADDVPRVLEVNAGRYHTTVEFYAHVGLNLPDLEARLAAGDTVTYPGVDPCAPGQGLWVRSVDVDPCLVSEDRWGS
jgi:carbamoyl-phosphate synthase large subunit